jgi:SHS family lactate transporter-like MFS transporter
MSEGVLKGWTRQQVSAVVAAFLGWTLDAFDFFLMVFVFEDIAKEFNTTVPIVAWAVTLTLAARFIGAFIFGRAADYYGRRPVLMIVILLYSFFAFVSGLSPNLMTLLVLRTLFGIAMGGEWGVGASLTMETIPAKARGLVSGLLQCGYPTGYLIASVVYATLYSNGILGWRGMIMLGALPALLCFYIIREVKESPGWVPKKGNTMEVVRNHWQLAIYMILLMTAFNFFSHGTQDLYPTFLRAQQKFDPATVGKIAVVYNIGAICGGLFFGSLSQRIGRKRAIVIAALLSLPVIPLWAFGSTAITLAAAAFAMQFMVQGAWGVIPAHLNELSPAAARGTFPGFTYQLGNFLASINAVLQGTMAADYGGIYSIPLALVAGTVAIAIALLVGFGIERKDVHLGSEDDRAPSPSSSAGRSHVGGLAPGSAAE